MPIVFLKHAAVYSPANIAVYACDGRGKYRSLHLYLTPSIMLNTEKDGFDGLTILLKHYKLTKEKNCDFFSPTLDSVTEAAI
jgi:hypothetical protein